MIEVPTVKTPITRGQAFGALQEAWGPGLTRELARGLLSLVWIETGAGNLNNNNPGNISASSQYSGKVWRPPWFAEPTPETSAQNVRLHAAMLANQAPSAFRAYDALSQGFSDFVAQLTHTFPEVLSAAQSGTPDTFRQALSQKYSRDYRNVKATDTFTKLWAEFDPLVSGLSSAVAVAAAVPLVPSVPGSESESSEPSDSSCGTSPLPEGGFLRGQEFSVPGIEDDEKKV